MADTIIQSLQEYLQECPLLENNRLNVDYLPEKPLTYMISPSPVDELIQPYLHGGAIRQYVFVMASVNSYSEEVLQNISNSGFYERLADWMRAETRRHKLPKLAADKKAMRLEALSTGYLQDASARQAHYQIQCRLVYFQQ